MSVIDFGMNWKLFPRNREEPNSMLAFRRLLLSCKNGANQASNFLQRFSQIPLNPLINSNICEKLLLYLLSNRYLCWVFCFPWRNYWSWKMRDWIEPVIHLNFSNCRSGGGPSKRIQSFNYSKSTRQSHGMPQVNPPLPIGGGTKASSRSRARYALVILLCSWIGYFMFWEHV